MAEAVDILRDALFGNPPSTATEPSREGTLAAFTMLSQAVNGALAGIVYYATGAARAADTGKPIGTIGKAADETDYYRRDGAGWVVDNSVAQGVTGIVQPIVDDATEARDETVALYDASKSGFSYDSPLSGAGNVWTLTFPTGVTYVEDALYRGLVPDDVSGPITVNGYNVIYDNGGPVGPEAGLKKDWAVTLRWNSGFWRLVSSAYDIVRLSDSLIPQNLGTKMVDLRDQPWGSVGAGNVVTATEAIITDCGPSTFTDVPGRSPGAPFGYAPCDVLANYLNDMWPLDGVNWIADKQAIGGQTINQFAAQLASSNAYTTARSRFVLVGVGANDWQVGNYNSGQAATGAREKLVELILANKAKGIKTLLCLSHHPQIALVDYTKYFTTDNPTAPQYYPRFVAAPVNPETGMYPPASKSAGGYGGVPKRDMTGSGILSEYDLRFWHGNRMARGVALQYPDDVILLDVEWAWFRHGVEVSGAASLFDQPSSGVNNIHPNVLGYQVSYNRVLRQFAMDLAAGRLMKRIYLGDS